MSGHGGFIQIGNNMPINTINTGNVGNVQPQENINLQPLNVEGEGQPLEEQEKVNPSKLAKQLDVLLLQAGKAATKGIDATALKEQVRDLGLSKKDLKTLNTLIDNAAKSLNALDKFTGRELAMATVMSVGQDSKYEFIWNDQEPAGKAIQTALDAQAALSAKLISLINTKGISDEAKDILDTAAMVCDRRSCEIETLLLQFSDAVFGAHGDSTALDKEVTARLDTKLFELMGEKSKTMFGNAEALAQMEEELAPLAERLDDFAANPEKNITSETFASMRKEFSDAKTALATLARDGYKVGNTRVIPDKAFMDAAKEVLAQVEKRMENARKKLEQAVLKSYLDSVFAPPQDLKILDPKFRPLLKLISSHTVKLVGDKEMMRNAAMEYAKDQSQANRTALEDAITDYNANPAAVGAANLATSIFHNAVKLLDNDAAGLMAKIEKAKGKMPQDVRDAITPELINEFKAALMEYTNGPQQAKAFTAFFKNGSYFKTQLAHIDDMLKTVKRMGDEEFLSSKTFLSAFKGELAPSTLVEARVHGMLDEDVDPATDQSNVEGCKELGSGAMNTVTAVTFKNGETKVFKPEAPGRESLEKAPAVYEGYEKNQQIAQLNMATQKTADVLGLGDIMVKTSVGKLNGQYGIFMEKAKGTNIPTFINNEKVERGSLNCNKVQMLPMEQHAKVQGQMMRKCNRLDWLDAITGQADRHNANVLVNVDKDGNVDIKCIDNDTCYPAYRIGMNKYVVAGRHVALFKQTLQNVSLLYGEKNKDKALNDLLKDKGITDNMDGTYTLDASKFEAPELNYCLKYTFGMFSNYVPNVIDKDLYDHLQTLKPGTEQREQYIADLGKRLPPAALDAAIKRLDDAIRHADELNKKGMVYTEEDWNDREKQNAVYGDPDDQKPVLDIKYGTRPRRNLACYEQIQGSINDMTQGNYKRNGFYISAKTGWFRKTE